MKETNRELWLSAPDDQLADSLKWIVKEWSDDTKAKDLLKLLDYCAYFGGGSQFVMNVLNIEYGYALKKENLTDNDVRKIADETWRKELN